MKISVTITTELEENQDPVIFLEDLEAIAAAIKAIRTKFSREEN